MDPEHLPVINNYLDANEPPSSEARLSRMHFHDNQRKVDYVLAYHYRKRGAHLGHGSPGHSLAVISNGETGKERLVYQYSYSHNGTLHGFVNHTLSFFNVSQLKEGTQPENSQFDQEVQFCRFKDYREPPWAPNPYEFSKQYWSVLSARLAFVIIFQNLVMFLSVLVDWMIPDIPTDISDQIKKEKSLLVDFFLKEEHEKVKLADEPTQRSQGGGDRSRRSRAASSAPSGRSQPGSIASSGSQHTNV